MKVSSTISPGLDENSFKGQLFASHQKGKIIPLDSLVMASAKSKENFSLLPDRILGVNKPKQKTRGYSRDSCTHGRRNYKDTKSRLYWCLIEFLDWRYSQLCLYFRPLL
jgi:hypothetical protein